MMPWTVGSIAPAARTHTFIRMGWIIDLLVIVLGISTLALGANGFSRRGLPLTPSKRLRGRPAMLVGAVCILLGAMWIIIGIWLGAGAPV
jgi:hypothetical protein